MPGVNGTRRKTAGRELEFAKSLVAMGVPVWAGRLTPEGNPDVSDRRWRAWQKKEADPDALSSWSPGDALCAVTGVVFDVLDYDPRNDPDGTSFDKMAADLGEDGPHVYWRVATPRGGRHLWIARLGLAKATGFMPGLDLQGGKDDGTGRGFVFLPGTERNGGTYVPRSPLSALNGGDPSVGPIREYISRCLEARASGGGSGSAGRQDVSALQRAVLTAPAGGQRPALLRLVHEWERQGKERSEIVLMLRGLLPGVKAFDGKDPWYPARGGNPDRHIQGLFHRAGAVVPDGTAEEISGIERPRTELMQSFADIGRERTQWVVEGMLARGEMTVFDGKKGVAKSLVILNTVSRLSRGETLPGIDGTGEKLHVAVFCSESSAKTEIGPRLDAAGAEVSFIHLPKIKKDKRGKIIGLVLPGGADQLGHMIREVDASIAVFDPINSFLDESINTNNDASVRRALSPLGQVLRETGCAGWLVRHLNKDSGASIDMRGAGSTAYQNIARIHMFAGKLPREASVEGRFGLGIIDSNLVKVEEGVLAYDAVDSEIVGDDAGNMVPVIEWHGWCNVKVEDLAASAAKARGPEATEQDKIQVALEEMFDRQDTWDVDKALAELAVYGCSQNEKTILKVRRKLQIRHVRIMNRGKKGGVEKWVWTNKTQKGRVRSNVRDEE
jgi:hypothetical protein